VRRLVNRALDLLLDFLRSHFHSVAFPELAAPTALSLRRFAKETRVAAWRARAKALVDAVASQATRVAQRRGSFDWLRLSFDARDDAAAQVANFVHAALEVRVSRGKGRGLGCMGGCAVRGVLRCTGWCALQGVCCAGCAGMSGRGCAAMRVIPGARPGVYCKRCAARGVRQVCAARGAGPGRRAHRRPVRRQGGLHRTVDT
jgi:hypothetical protein